jgi:hypothetical protein
MRVIAMRTTLHFLLSIVLVLATACGGGTTKSKDTGPAKDAVADAAALPDSAAADPGAVDVASPEVAPVDVPVASDVAIEEEVLADVPPVEGEFGWKCTEHGQCNSNFCIDSPDGKVCTTICQEKCPDGWSCKSLTVGSDILSLCVPLYLYLCDPCEANKDCNGEATGGNALCIDRGPAGKFCGGDCSATGKCPMGYACQEATDSGGVKGVQCVPEADATCACSGRAIQLGLGTTCFDANEFGTCTGSRRCIVTGLTACDAKKPSVEACDGIDNDCDTLIDELQDTIECSKKVTIDGAERECKGKGECVNGSIVNCDAATPVPEICNGLDDDCNGQIDDAICNDGNPCTADFCNVGGTGCTYEPKAGPCDDGNPCTINDHCDTATVTCIGGSQKSCDDGNVCTDDFCDTGTGDCLHSNNTKACDDGDFCTNPDVCANGACQSGATKDCNDDNPCRKDFACDKATGNCTWKPGNEGMACDDATVCTTNTKCSNGQCAGGQDICELKSCPVPAGKTFCAAPACSLLGEMLGPLCICACI